MTAISRVDATNVAALPSMRPALSSSLARGPCLTNLYERMRWDMAGVYVPIVLARIQLCFLLKPTLHRLDPIAVI